MKKRESVEPFFTIALHRIRAWIRTKTSLDLLGTVFGQKCFNKKAAISYQCFTNKLHIYNNLDKPSIKLLFLLAKRIIGGHVFCKDPPHCFTSIIRLCIHCIHWLCCHFSSDGPAIFLFNPPKAISTAALASLKQMLKEFCWGLEQDWDIRHYDPFQERVCSVTKKYEIDMAQVCWKVEQKHIRPTVLYDAVFDVSNHSAPIQDWFATHFTEPIGALYYYKLRPTCPSLICVIALGNINTMWDYIFIIIPCSV